MHNNYWGNGPGAEDSGAQQGFPPQQQWQPPSSGRKNTKGRSAFIACLVVGVIACCVAAYFLTGGLRHRNDQPEAQALQQSEHSAAAATSATSAQSQAAAESDGRCSPEALSRLLPSARKFSAKYCKGNWMLGGPAQTGNLNLYFWDGQRWLEYRDDGKTGFGFSCYDMKKLDEAEAPPELKTLLDSCSASSATPKSEPKNPAPRQEFPSPAGIPAAMPDCDGRWILIQDSVVVPSSQDPEGPIAVSLRAHPNASWTIPGKCPSLRASIDAGRVYPIYSDYGSDVDAVCSAKARYGGNARQLNTTGKIIDPC